HWRALAKEARIRPCRNPTQNRFTCAASMPRAICGGFMRCPRSPPCSESVADPQLGPDPHGWQSHGADLRRQCGGGRSVRTAGACQAKARLRCSRRKAVTVRQFLGDYGSACDAGSICSTALMSDEQNRNKTELVP